MQQRIALCAAALILTSPPPALAWGSLGHRIIGEAAARNFPKEVPAFLRSPAAMRQIGELAREPDRSRGAGQPHDWDLDPGHFVDLSDDGTILGGPRLDALPASRRDYDTALRAAGRNEFIAGFLPYSLMDGWQQLVKDFTLWRADVAGAKFARSRAERQWYERDRALREMLTLRDLGTWAHFVGDASQPLHVTMHYDGWGDGPNPQGFTTQGGLHAKFESDFINANVREADVTPLLRPYRDCACALPKRMQDYLLASGALVTRTFQFEKDGAFDKPTPEAKAFAAQRLAEGAAQLRDMVTDAWRASGEASIGYRDKITVADLEAGKFDPAILIHEMRD